MDLKAQTTAGAELMFEIDSLYVSTEMILGGRFRELPLDGLLLEACLLHFRIVWDFFYKPAKKSTDIVAGSFIPNWTAPSAPARLEAVRKWLDVMLAHLTTHRTDPAYKIGEITGGDVGLIREHTKTLFEAFVKPLSEEQRKLLANPLPDKFPRYKTLKP
jgi:hypothetical protein